MTPIVALVWVLTVDAGPQDSKPITQILNDAATDIRGTEGQCRVSAVFPDGERRLACQIGEAVVGISMTCKQGDAKDSTLVIMQNDAVFRVKMVCGTPKGSGH